MWAALKVMKLSQGSQRTDVAKETRGKGGADRARQCNELKEQGGPTLEPGQMVLFSAGQTLASMSLCVVRAEGGETLPGSELQHTCPFAVSA